MKNSTPWVFLLVLLFSYTTVHAQSCPPRLGDYKIATFAASERSHYYAREIPGGAPAGSEARRTVVLFEFNSLNLTNAQTATVTYYPTLDGSSYG